MCYCKNIEIGSYDNQIMVYAPNFMLPLINCLGEIKEPKICLDKCIANEVLNLWNLEIRTVGCCCGHNIANGYIQVADECVESMLKLGYELDDNKMNNCFHIKTIKLKVMKREILFKGKSKSTGEWFFGNLFDKDTSGKTHIGTTTKGCFDINPETVCQFAGFTDINDKKVFEGDYDKDGNCVVFCDECHGWQFGQIDIPSKQVYIPCHNCDGNFMVGDWIEKFEVVGNIND